MINLEQVKLLETKVSKVVDYLDRLTKESDRLTKENAALHQQKTELQEKLDSCQKRIEELEVLVTDFKEDQGQIEEGILAALDRLSQFEKAIDKSLKDSKAAKEPVASPSKDSAPAAKKSLLVKAAEDAAAAEAADADTSADTDASASVDGDQTCFEIPGEVAEDDVADPLGDAANVETASAENRELDIF